MQDKAFGTRLNRSTMETPQRGLCYKRGQWEEHGSGPEAGMNWNLAANYTLYVLGQVNFSELWLSDLKMEIFPNSEIQFNSRMVSLAAILIVLASPSLCRSHVSFLFRVMSLVFLLGTTQAVFRSGNPEVNMNIVSCQEINAKLLGNTTP